MPGGIHFPGLRGGCVRERAKMARRMCVAFAGEFVLAVGRFAAGRDSVMPPLRFLHAAGLDPDAVIAAPPAGLADLFASAPMAAVTQLVSRAIELEVDFLLVTPAVPAEGLPDGPSVAAEAALRKEFDRLLEHEITVFLAVGSQSSGWQRLAGRGSNVVLLTPEMSTPVSDRQGRPAGTLRCVSRLAQGGAERGPQEDGRLNVTVAPQLSFEELPDSPVSAYDYIGLGIGPRATEPFFSGLAHAPGLLQATDRSGTGPHGATLVGIDENEKIRTEFVPTARVRFESLPIQAAANDVIEDLALKMAERFEGLKPEPGEAAWVVSWEIEAAGSLCGALSSAAGRGDLVSLLPERVGDVSVAHEVVLRPHVLWTALEDPFAAEYAAALKEMEPALARAESRLSFIGLAEDALHRDRLARLLAAADGAAVLGGARRLGLLVTAAADGMDED